MFLLMVSSSNIDESNSNSANFFKSKGTSLDSTISSLLPNKYVKVSCLQPDKFSANE